MGPLVDPGEYTVRLSVGGKQWTTFLSVEEDDAVQISQKDRQLLRATLDRLLRAMPFGQEAARTADSLDQSIASAVRSLADSKAASSNLKTAMENAGEQIKDIQAKLRRASSRINALYGEVNGAPFAPTSTQCKELDEFAGQLESQVSVLNNFISKTMPALESQMSEEKIPRFRPVQPVRAPGADPQRGGVRNP